MKHISTAITTGTEINIKIFNSYVSYLDTAPKTVETYTKALRQFFNYLAENRITQPAREDIKAYKESLANRGLKPTTIQNYITAVKIFFTWTAQEGIYPNIADHIKGAKLDRNHKKDYLTTAQVKAVINSIDRSSLQGKRDYALFVLMVTGGLRDIEVSRANIEDLRPLGEQTALYVQGKGHTEKTEFIKIPLQAEIAVRTYLKARGIVKAEEPLFTSLSNNSKGKRLSTRTISGIIKSTLIKAGFNSERLTAHSLRHTAVTLSLLAEKDITEVQQFARHANITTTMIYNHSLEKAKNSCSNAIADMIFA